VTKPLRKVTNLEYCGASRYTGYVDKTAKLTLECGHVRHQKASQTVPVRARCSECEADETNLLREIMQ
jgi:hypothetical protein